MGEWGARNSYLSFFFLLFRPNRMRGPFINILFPVPFPGHYLTTVARCDEADRARRRECESRGVGWVGWFSWSGHAPKHRRGVTEAGTNSAKGWRLPRYSKIKSSATIKVGDKLSKDGAVGYLPTCRFFCVLHQKFIYPRVFFLPQHKVWVVDFFGGIICCIKIWGRFLGSEYASFAGLQTSVCRRSAWCVRMILKKYGKFLLSQIQTPYSQNRTWERKKWKGGDRKRATKINGTL